MLAHQHGSESNVWLQVFHSGYSHSTSALESNSCAPPPGRGETSPTSSHNECLKNRIFRLSLNTHSRLYCNIYIRMNMNINDSCDRSLNTEWFPAAQQESMKLPCYCRSCSGY
ncbi:hypothetical protein GOODEAATRI_032238 [Goodea atripinnis]|uniref:Uncharacterized protein n=1 Tax=Goodea atripinnis TaxID=208336 RepID=A0ABV0Q3A9_9TELE